MRITKRTAATWTVALAAAGLLAGCGGQNPAGAPADEDYAGQAAYNNIIAQVYGNAEQRAAAAERSWLISQTAIATCAKPKGADYAVTPFQPMDNPGVLPAPGDLLGFAPQRTDFGVGKRIEMLAKRGEPVNPGLAALKTDDAREKWFAAVGSCQNAPQADDLLAAPPGQEELERELVEVLSKAQNESAPDLPQQYAACMKAAGIAAGDLSEAYQTVEAAYPPVSFEKASDPTELPEWAAAVAYERKVAAADWDCRAERADAVKLDAAGTLRNFASQHQGELMDQANAWAALPTEAQKLRSTLNITP